MGLMLFKSTCPNSPKIEKNKSISEKRNNINVVPINPKHCPKAAKIKSVCASGIEMIFACNPYPVNPALPSDNNAVYN